MQSHGLIWIKVRISDENVDHSRRKRGILEKRHVFGSNDTSNIQERVELEMYCSAVPAQF